MSDIPQYFDAFLAVTAVRIVENNVEYVKITTLERLSRKFGFLHLGLTLGSLTGGSTAAICVMVLRVSI